MKCKISCSFGEIVDKLTILKIKEVKAASEESLQNIQKEINIIEEEIPDVKSEDKLFNELSDINKKLWDCEDLIREKSKYKQFDNIYIQCAESIHIFNDQRYKIKRQINKKYKSELQEEKLYNDIDIKDKKKLEIGKNLYTDGHYEQSLSCIEKLIKKYSDYSTLNSFYIDLLFSYSNICIIFNKTFPYFTKIQNIMSKLDIINISKEQIEFCKKIYCTICLQQQKYQESYDYLNYINNIAGPNVSRFNMSFFNKNDMNKTLLIYDGGGIGDKMMLSRFIPELCILYSYHHIKFLVPNSLLWFFKMCFKNFKNLTIISDNTPQFIGKFDYHCNLLSLLKYLHLTYDTIKPSPIYKCICVTINEQCDKIIKSFNKKTYILNWKGNPKNGHEKHNRMMNLINAIPLFNMEEIQWLVVTKDITTQERQLLKKYNVMYYGDMIDNHYAFYDTIALLPHVDGVVSTDTSLPHISLSLGIKTYVLLTVGCEWRWTSNKKTNWYPDAILLRQKTISKWDTVIEELKSKLLK